MRDNKFNEQSAISAEAAFLGGLFLDTSQIKDFDDIKVEDFSTAEHQNIYAAILDLHKHENPVDLVTVSTVLQSKGQLEAITPEYIAEIQNEVPVATHTPQYAKIVKHRSLLRELEKVGQKMAQMDGSAEEITQKLFESLKGIKEKIKYFQPKIEEEEIDPIDTTRTQLTWGTPGLDKVITPIEDYHFILAAAETKTGKTAFLFDLAIKNTAAGKVLYISLEQSKNEIITRIARDYAGIQKHQWGNRAEIPEKQYHAYKKRRTELRSMKNLVATGIDNCTVESIFKKIKEEKPILTIVDNLDLIESNLREENDQQKMITKQFAQFTTKYKMPIILVHHLKKGSEGKQKIRGINAIKGSSKNTHNPNTVLMFHRCQSTSQTLLPKEKAQFTVVQIADREFGTNGVHTVFFNKGTFEDDYKGLNQVGFD